VATKESSPGAKRGDPEAAEDAGRFIPRHVERTVERFPGCGDPREGFAWLVWSEATPSDCDHHRLVRFAWKNSPRVVRRVGALSQ
jgi:hypothetical protein